MDQQGTLKMKGDNFYAFLFLLPFLLCFLIFFIFPTFFSFYVSVSKWGILGKPSFIGINNFKYVLSDESFLQSLGNTLLFTGILVPSTIVISIFLAMLMNSGGSIKVLSRTMVFLPRSLMVSAVGTIWLWLLNKNWGIFNYYLNMVGVPDIAWLSDGAWARVSIILVTLWWTLNFSSIIYLAGLQNIPTQLYESADLDGASWWQKLIYITIPGLRHVHAFVIPMAVIASLRVFGQVLLLTGGGPNGKTSVLVQYIYSTAFQSFKMGIGAAAGVILFFITFALTVAQLKAMKTV